MTDWYFDQVNGSDSTGDGSDGNPYKTTTKLSTLASGGTFNAGGRAILKPGGTYTGRILLNGFHPTSGFQVMGDQRSATLPVVTSGDSHDVLINDASDTIVTGLDMRLPTATPAASVTISGTCSNITISNSLISDSASNGVLATGTISGLIVRACTVTNATEDGIGGLGTVSGFLVENNTIDKCGNATYAGSAGDGVSWHEDSDGTVRYNTIRRCSKGGITNVQRSGHTIACYGNFISDCVRWGMAGHQNGTDTIGSHDWYSNVILMADTNALISAQTIGMLFRGRTDAVNHFNVYGNTVINPVDNSTTFSYGAFLGDPDYMVMVTMRNNVSMCLANAGRHICIPRGNTWFGTGSTVDYGAYYPNDNPRFVADPDGVSAAAYLFAAWQNLGGSGVDVHGGIADPVFALESAITPPGAYNWATDANRWPAGRSIDDFQLMATSTIGTGAQALGAPYNSDARARTRKASPSFGAHELILAGGKKPFWFKRARERRHHHR